MEISLKMFKMQGISIKIPNICLLVSPLLITVPTADLSVLTTIIPQRNSAPLPSESLVPGGLRQTGEVFGGLWGLWGLILT